MFVAVLSSREHSPSNRVIVDRIQDSLSAVEGLLNSLLDVSKLEAGFGCSNLGVLPRSAPCCNGWKPNSNR